MDFLKNEFRKRCASKFHHLFLFILNMVRSTLLVFCYLMAEMPFGPSSANIQFSSNICTVPHRMFHYQHLDRMRSTRGAAFRPAQRHQKLAKDLRRGTVPHRMFYYSHISRMRSIRGIVFNPAQWHHKMARGLRRGTVPHRVFHYIFTYM